MRDLAVNQELVGLTPTGHPKVVSGFTAVRPRCFAPVVELVDTPDSESGAERCARSNRARGTNHQEVHSHAWLTWWVSDTVGVLLAGPLLLPLVEAVWMG